MPPDTTAPTPIKKILASVVGALCGLIFSAAKGIPDEAAFTALAIVGATNLWSFIEYLINGGWTGGGTGGTLAAIVLPVLLVLGSVGVGSLSACGTLRPAVDATVTLELHPGPPCAVSATVDSRAFPLLDYPGACPIEVAPNCLIDEGHLFCPADDGTGAWPFATPEPAPSPTPDDNTTGPSAVNDTLTPAQHTGTPTLFASLPFVMAGLFTKRTETGGARSTLRELHDRAQSLASDLDHYRSTKHAPSPLSWPGRALRDAVLSADRCAEHIETVRTEHTARRRARRGVA